MYVLATDPLPQNSLQGMPAAQQAEMRNCIDAWNQAAAQAKRNAYIYPSVASGGRLSANLEKDMILGQRDAKLAAFSILTNQAPAAESSENIAAPEVLPMNTVTENACDFQTALVPPAMRPAERVFLQPAPSAPQRFLQRFSPGYSMETSPLPAAAGATQSTGGWPMIGLGDSPNWADAYGNYQNVTLGDSVLSALRNNPWLGVLLLAGVLVGVGTMGKRR